MLIYHYFTRKSCGRCQRSYQQSGDDPKVLNSLSAVDVETANEKETKTKHRHAFENHLHSWYLAKRNETGCGSLFARKVRYFL